MSSPAESLRGEPPCRGHPAGIIPLSFSLLCSLLLACPYREFAADGMEELLVCDTQKPTQGHRTAQAVGQAIINYIQ